ncbi:MAG: alpha-ketoglutarate-dependent dioxygenase AlkB, partial [Deltaproteobacteria bacterium]
MPLQQSLFDRRAASIDTSFSRVERIQLDETAWIDFEPEWVSGADSLFDEIIAARNWKQRTRRMYDKRVLEPRLTAPWNLASGGPLVPPLIEEMRRSLSGRYGVEFDSVG